MPGRLGRPGFGTVPSEAGGFGACGRAFGNDGDVGSGGSEAGGTTDGVTGAAVRVTPEVPTASDARNSGLDAGGMGCVAGCVASGSVSGAAPGDVGYVEYVEYVEYSDGIVMSGIGGSGDVVSRYRPL